MSESQNSEEPKIIVDEDWKTKVQREQEEAKQEQQDTSTEASASADSEIEADSQAANSQTTAQEDASNAPGELPPADMGLLITSLATQAMAAMGQMPGEDGQPLPKNLPVAQHYIDLLGMLEEKTKGNLDDQESRYLSEALHQLRMLFVNSK